MMLKTMESAWSKVEKTKPKTKEHIRESAHKEQNQLVSGEWLDPPDVLQMMMTCIHQLANDANTFRII